MNTMVVSDQQLGQTIQKVDDLVGTVKDHITTSDFRHTDAEKRLRFLEDVWKFGKWIFIGLGILYPILMPTLQKIFFHFFYPNADISSVVSFLDVTKHFQ